MGNKIRLTAFLELTKLVIFGFNGLKFIHCSFGAPCCEYTNLPKIAPVKLKSGSPSTSFGKSS